jgi:hypothetical protein
MSGESSMGIQRTVVVYVFTESTGSTDIGESFWEYIYMSGESSTTYSE